ncbi:hypothetical protein L208DRAFT_1406233 [Tricholoma matsutake]|nr:hypothetical protein L208DRAFT_1406233 [Tricholoma matsutake 945]
MLLTAMDDSIDYYFKDPTFPTVAASFRAASLLQFQKMLVFAQKYLNREFSGRLMLSPRHGDHDNPDSKFNLHPLLGKGVLLLIIHGVVHNLH